jgi:hypothetical protein
MELIMLLKVAVLPLSVGNVYGKSGEFPQEVPPNIIYTMHFGGNQQTNKIHTRFTLMVQEEEEEISIYICDCTREECETSTHTSKKREKYMSLL